jgi:5-methylthioribose kinase
MGTFPKYAMTVQATDTTDDHLLSTETVGSYLVSRGIFGDAAGVSARELAGGISNVVLAVSRGELHVVVKQALPRLRVPEEWLAKRERAITEGEALRLAGRITPGCVPATLDVDRDRCALTIEAAPVEWTSWKDRLLAGDADPAVASRLGEILASWHQETARDDDVARVFADAEAFDQLRVDPYYRTVARRLPELAAAIEAYVQRMLTTHTCLVHGDYSPKNVLVGDGVWVVDFEVAHVGDPAFDIAFMLNHLMLKGLRAPATRSAFLSCARAFWSAYRGAAGAELLPDLSYVLGHVGCLMVARVDGKSPVEYLSPSDREAARAIGSRLLLAPPDSLDDALAAIGSALA